MVTHSRRPPPPVGRSARVSFFAMALLAHLLGRRAVESEQLATQRGSDLANLAQLNDFVIQQMRAGILVIDEQETIQVMNEAAWCCSACRSRCAFTR